MAGLPKSPCILVMPLSKRSVAVLSAALMAGACSGGLGEHAQTSLRADTPPPSETAAAEATPQSELEKATSYWGKEFSKNPRNLDAALAYAKNLKAMGQKGQALSVMQQASLFHGSDKRLASEYGRLALELDQLSVAAPLLEAADDPTAPDWKVISARGTVLAKQGRYKDAIPLYERALTLAQDQPSVTNNLAMAYAMSGEPGKAEELLRKAATADSGNPKVRQNLAIVLGLQGKHDEARSLSSGTALAESTAHNSEIVRRLVRNDAKPEAAAVQTAKAPPGARPAAQPAKATATALKPSASDPTAVADGPAQLADAAAEPLFKPSAR